MVFLSQYFLIPNYNRLFNTVLKEKRIEEEEWMKIIETNCPNYKDLVEQQAEMKEFEDVLHSYYQSIPVEKEEVFCGDLHHMQMIENVRVA